VNLIVLNNSLNTISRAKYYYKEYKVIHYHKKEPGTILVLKKDTGHHQYENGTGIPGIYYLFCH
jgi:hypothetical protein